MARGSLIIVLMLIEILATSSVVLGAGISPEASCGDAPPTGPGTERPTGSSTSLLAIGTNQLPCNMPSLPAGSRPGPVPPFFFFQAEDGIRDGRVTGVQTCALPI